MSKSALLLFPHQLYDVSLLPQVDRVYMVEDPLYFGTDQQRPMTFHKQKLMLHRASMNAYVEQVLWPADYHVDYIPFDDDNLAIGHFAILSDNVDIVYVFDPTDDVLLRRIHQSAVDAGGEIDLRVLPSPNFYLSYKDAHEYFSDKSRHVFADFYQWQRERFNVLIEDYRPMGGKWIHESKPTRLKEGDVPPGFATFGDNKYVEEAREYVHRNFPQNFGNTDNFMWPVSHEEASKWLVEFVNERLDDFAKYEQSISSESPFVYHSLLSAALNIGLLTPQEVVDEALKRHARRPVPLESLESFIRQILGWREYVRGQYVANSDAMRGKNYLDHQRRITIDWHNATTGIEPFDDLVLKTDRVAYAHQSERLMIAGALMIIAELHPNDMYRWYGERFIDAYDWIMLPNVYGMAQFVEGSDMITTPYIVSSDELLKISNYARADWCDIWDGMFWNFIQSNKDKLHKNPRMKAVVDHLSRLDVARHRIIGYRAQDFLNAKTKSVPKS